VEKCVRIAAIFAVVCALALVVWPAGSLRAQQDPRLTFRADVARVTLNVVVRDQRGRPLTGLTLSDFQVFDEDQAVAVSDFQTDETPVSVALLVDTSGSMRIGDRLAAARRAGQMLVAALRSGEDEVALFTFDLMLHALAPFSSQMAAVRPALERIAPFGSTSLHDAIAATARRSVERPTGRRAVVVITDGLDTSSELSAAQASSIASSIDVPVYILGVDAMADPPAVEDLAQPDEQRWSGRLDYLARWSGGAFLGAHSETRAQAAVSQIVSDLRSGYLMAFAPRDRPGWHRVTVKVARANAQVRTRGGFWIGKR
jgi:Ca-activated chloride channel family protein